MISPGAVVTCTQTGNALWVVKARGIDGRCVWFGGIPAAALSAASLVPVMLRRSRPR